MLLQYSTGVWWIYVELQQTHSDLFSLVMSILWYRQKEIINKLIPISQPSFSIFHLIEVQMLQSIEQAKEKWAQLLWEMKLEERTGTGTSPDEYFFVFNTLLICQLLFTHNTQVYRNSLSTHEKNSVILLY